MHALRTRPIIKRRPLLGGWSSPRRVGLCYGGRVRPLSAPVVRVYGGLHAVKQGGGSGDDGLGLQIGMVAGAHHGPRRYMAETEGITDTLDFGKFLRRPVFFHRQVIDAGL